MKHVTMLLSLSLLFGCQPSEPAQAIPTPTAPAAVWPPPPQLPPEDWNPVDVKPEWEAFALSRYRELVRASLKAPATALFVGDPWLGASRETRTGMYRLSAIGEVDAQNGFGALIRSTYIVGWRSKTGVFDDSSLPADHGAIISSR